MDLQNANEFKRTVENILSNLNVACRNINGGDRKDSILNQQLFFDLSRKGKHQPDLIITSENIPCELKSPKEIYKMCRYSNSHLYSYLLQAIFGQCFSYADLYRPSNNSSSILSIYLIIPKVITNEVQIFQNIEDYFNNILMFDWHPFLELMQVESIDFCSPLFCSHTHERYGLIGSNAIMLCTKIVYHCRTN